ncbi:hypothetical protein FQN50_003435 [Emmonsiellopsis sp. PD_5]|nr:hypothetical protein FQN50_003435 [Emmonsiellopsis sp. PD_5]
MLRKSTLICSCGGFQLFHPLPGTSIHAPHFASTPRRKPALPHCRGLAHVRGSYPLGSEADLSWPSTATFTPYDIFKQAKTEPYSKRRYYDLVKVYHPDRYNPEHPICKTVPEAVRLHRYRLIVAAHEILSDPAKRDAYDRFGLGWQQRAELFADKSGRTCTPRYERHMDDDDSIYRNATWEDWERWYRRHDQPRQQTQTVSHETFASFLILLVLFGGIGQAITIGNHASYVEQRAKDVDEKCGKFLNGRRQQTIAQMDSQDAKLQSFLMRRDPSGYGLKEEEEETYRTVFSPRTTSSALDEMDRPSQAPAETKENGS